MKIDTTTETLTRIGGIALAGKILALPGIKWNKASNPARLNGKEWRF